MKDHLEYIFSNVNDWLKFAEAKSATLLAANGVMLFGILRLAKDQELGVFTNIGLFTGCICFSISLVFCLSSFVPSLTMPWVHKKYDKTANDNLLFFGHIENYTPHAYLKALRLSCGEQAGSDDKYLEMLAQQVITNSVIASYKYSIFKKSIWLTLIGFVIICAASLCYFWL